MAAAAAVKQGITQSRWIPQFTRGGRNFRKPSEFTIDCTKYQGKMHSSTELQGRVREMFTNLGLVYLTNTGTNDATYLQKAFAPTMGNGQVYEGGANPRTTIEGNVYDTGVSMESFVHYHHEMAYLEESVELLAFFCNRLSAGVPGSTYVSDNVGVTDAIASTSLGQKLKDRGICYIRKLTDAKQFTDKPPIGVYNHWQKSFLTEDQEVAERSARERGLVVEWDENNQMITKFYAPSYEYCPYIDRNLLYASMADHSIWFDTWPHVQQLPQEERPLKMTYGDDSEFTIDEVSEFTEIYDDFGLQLPWKEGDAGLVCNYRFLHGRPVVHLAPGQERVLGVVLGNKFRRIGAQPGKW
jgi:hypothetical protein